MTPEPTPETTPQKTTRPAKAPAAEPAVEAATSYNTGDEVIHANGQKYTVRHQTPEGVALEGVANLVHPLALKKA